MFSRTELKSNAKKQLNGKWGLAIITCLVYTLIIQGTLASSGNNSVSDNGGFYIALNLLGWVLYGPISIGMCIFTLNLARNKESAQFIDLFSGFKLILKAFLLTLIFNIVMRAGYMLFIIPGIIAGLMFSQAYYVMAENPELSSIQCLSKSGFIHIRIKLYWMAYSLRAYIWNWLFMVYTVLPNDYGKLLLKGKWKIDIKLLKLISNMY